MSDNLQTNVQANEDDLLSIRQAAKLLKVNRYWLSTHLKAIKVNLISIGPSLGVRRSDLSKVELPASTNLTREAP